MTEEATGAPESYEDFTLPEGATFEGDDLTNFQSFAKEAGLSQAQAQTILSRELSNRPAPAASGAPESYSDFTLPEGQNLEGDSLTEFQTFAKENGLTQEQAQKALDREFATRQSVSESIQAEATAAREQWEADVKADKDIGGDKFEENLGVAKQALETFGSSELKDMLNKSGMGSHPEVVRFFLKVGQAISEDKLEKGGGTPPEPKRFFKNSDHALS